jgi:hypothetical protein
MKVAPRKLTSRYLTARRPDTENFNHTEIAPPSVCLTTLSVICGRTNSRLLNSLGVGLNERASSYLGRCQLPDLMARQRRCNHLHLTKVLSIVIFPLMLKLCLFIAPHVIASIVTRRITATPSSSASTSLFRTALLRSREEHVGSLGCNLKYISRNGRTRLQRASLEPKRKAKLPLRLCSTSSSFHVA